MWQYSYTDRNNDFLAHHGILGQKWGVRRFQNKDGSLTAAGRARYIKSNTDRSISKYETRYAKQGVKVSKDTRSAIEKLNEARLNKDGAFKKRDARLVARANLYADRGDAIRKKGASGAGKILKRAGLITLAMIPAAAGGLASGYMGSVWPEIAGIGVSTIVGTALATQFNKSNQAVRNSLARETMGSKRFNEHVRNRGAYRSY